MRVSEIMTKDVACVRTDEACSAAARLMWDCDCGAVPVVDRAGDRVLGMITDRDICIATWSRDCAPSAIRVSDAMSRDLYHCAPGDGIGLAENLMRSKQIRRIPVLDTEQRLLGILSLADIARSADGAGRGSTSSEIGDREIASTLANICEPPRATAATTSSAL